MLARPLDYDLLRICSRTLRVTRRPDERSSPLPDALRVAFLAGDAFRLNFNKQLRPRWLTSCLDTIEECSAVPAV